MQYKEYIYKVLFFWKKKLNFIGPPLSKDENYNPFFIIGSGRSGNTLLRRILNNHGELYIPPETYVLGKSIRQSLRYPQLSWSDLVSLIYSTFEYYPEYETFKMGSLNSLFQKVSKVDKNKQSIAYILNAFYEQYKYEHNIKSLRWGDKTPANTSFVFELKSVFPNAKFLHMVRDPYDCIVSYVDSGIYDNLEDATLRWRKSLEQAFKFEEQYPSSYFEITYTELVSDTDSIIRKTCDFLNIKYEPEMIESNKSMNDLGDVYMRKHHEKVTRPIDSKSIGKGLKNLKKNEIMTINKIISLSKNKRVRSFVNE